jgi:hypothetical protein
MAKETAESKLLKLIEEADAKDTPASASGASASAATQASQVLSSVSSVGVQSIPIPPFIQKILALFSKGSSPSAGFGLRVVNAFLVFLIFIFGFFFAQDFSRGMKESQAQVAFEIKQAADDGKLVALPTVNDADSYIEQISKRNIFRPFEKKVEEIKIVAPEENQQIKDKVTNFKLVGISWLSTPETATAMIEDKSTSVTHFLKKGDDLEGVKLDVIYADRVEFSFNGEKLTMNL